MGQFDLDRELFQLNGKHPYTIRDSYEGILITGAIGSGKSSGSGSTIAKSLLRKGYGGLVLTVKPEEALQWKQYARETGREESLLVFDDSGEYCFPFLDYEITRDGQGRSLTTNIVRIFMNVNECIGRKSGSGGDNYWERALEQLLNHIVNLAIISGERVSVPLLYEIVRSIPRHPDEIVSEEWRKHSTCWRLLVEANEREKDKWTQFDYDSTASYFLEELVHLSEKTRSGIISMFTTTLDLFMRKPFRMLFSEYPEDPKKIVYPELTHHGAVIVMNLPVKEFSDAGKAAQIMYKYLWQIATERRDIQQNDRGVFLWIDEAQNLVSDYDMQFMATSRSSRASTVYLTQNLPNLFAELGNHDRVHSLVGNFSTKIMHCNSDPQSNTFFADVIGRSWQNHEGNSHSLGNSSFSMGQSNNESFDYDVPPQWFTRLPKGGPANNNTVGAIVFQNGRTWENDKTYLYAEFKQS